MGMSSLVIGWKGVTDLRLPMAALIGGLIMVSILAASADMASGDGGGATTQSVDLRPIFQNWGLTVRSQGNRNTCSVCTVTDAIEYALATKTRTGRRLSAEFLNWAKNQTTGHDVDGGFFSDTWNGFAKYGISTIGEMPYQGKSFDPTTRPTEQALEDGREVLKAGLRMHWIKRWDSSKGASDEQVEEIKRTLRKQWPVCAGNLWPKEHAWKGDVLQIPPRDQMRDGHSVLLVGYQDDPDQPGGGVFIFRNTARADHFGEMPYEYARKYMNDAIWIDYDGAGGSTEPATQSARGIDLLGPFGSAPVGRNRRVSSNEQPDWNNANMDMTWLMPGEKLEMPLLTGPGVITHMWFTSHSGWVSELNSLSIRIYWDGQSEPGVEAPLGDFFGVGQGKPAVVNSFPVQVSPTGGLSCYWRMPFKKSARIVITNDNPDRSTGLYWQVDWTQVDKVPEDAPYFCACYRQEYPAVLGRDYMFADLAGSGQYIGTVMSVTLAQDGWFGEGDDFFYIDGEAVPSLQGTGSEDYFNDAWGFRPRSSTWFGSPRWSEEDRAGESGVCYRWHVLDAVNFSKSLKVTIEHKGNHPNDVEGFFIERPDFISSVAFWYQNGEPKLFARLPEWKDRRVPWQDHLLVRGYRQVQSSGEAKVKIDTGGLFGARPLLYWPNRSAGAEMTVPIQLEEGGERVVIRLLGAKDPEFGAYDVLIDGKKIATADFRAESHSDCELMLGTFALQQGEHRLTFRAVDSAERMGEKAGPLAVEMISFLKLPAVAGREIKGHNEAHFVRLAIGRAVYAYRLAYDALPDSLQTLVDAGILSERFLKDENNEPLISRREGESFMVESTHNEKWIKSWKGLDARR